MDQQDEQSNTPDAAPAPATAASTSVQDANGVNLDLLLDVPVTLSVEIGRARMSISELLALNPDSVVELDREVNDPLDLMVNGTLIARGEVVETDGRFGLRLLDVVSPPERLKKAR